MNKDKESARLKAAEIARRVIKEQLAANQFEIPCVFMVQVSRKAAKYVAEIIRQRKGVTLPDRRALPPAITINPDKC